MEQAEVFHIYHQGEQRGPYSVRQVNHLYRCGYICDETLYWRDGMEQWQPVTEIVDRRRRRKRLRRWGITLGISAFLAVLVFLFGPVTRDAWRELTSGEYTSESAWWRARGMVRERLADGERVLFDSRSSASVELADSNVATVVLGGQVTDEKNQQAHVSWTVRLQYDPERHLWQSLIPRDPTPAVAPIRQVNLENAEIQENPAPVGKGKVTASAGPKTLTPE